MNGSLAEMVALVAHGNVFLAHGGSPPQLAGTNSTFQHVPTLRFVYPLSQLHDASTSSPSGATSDAVQRSPAPDVASTGDWFQSLKDCGVGRLWLARFQRRGAIKGFLDEEIYAETAEAAWRWRRSSESTLTDDGLRSRVLGVTYRGTAADGPRPDLPELASARQELAHALRGAIQFASEARLRIWPELLEAAYSQLQSVTPQLSYNPDILPADGYSLEARQLLAAGDAAWVFGGMGSWNDLVFDGALKDQYRRITHELLDAVMNAIVAATNAFESHQG